VAPDDARPPGPPAPPRCPECRGPFSVGGAIRHHEPDCSIGREGQRRAQVERDITAAFSKALAAKRGDVAFMDRLHARITADAAILDRLAHA
jgi:hypothetical protein